MGDQRSREIGPENGTKPRGEDSPEVTILVPTLNEETRIGPAIRSVLDDFVRARAEILVIDGGSTDGTLAAVDGLIREGAPIRVLGNPFRIQAQALNLGVREARGKYVVRLDAHCLYPPRYVERCLALLEEKGAACAGGIMRPKGETPVQKAIAAAMSHPFGVGDARYHLGGYSGEYEGVYLGAFRREVFETAGLFDPRAVTNEDAELFARIRKQGGKIWLDGDLRVEYFPRRSLKALFSQYFRYGQGRFYTTQKHGRFSSWRQVVPLAHLLLLILSILLAPVFPVLLLYPSIYLFSALAISLFGKFESAPFSIRGFVFLSFIIMHTAWAAGFFGALLHTPDKSLPLSL